MSPDYHRVSPYYAAITRQIELWRTSGVGAFTPSQLAQSIGRNVTPSMRKALAHAESMGLIEKYRYYTERGGVAVAYGIITPSENDETVEFPF